MNPRLFEALYHHARDSFVQGELRRRSTLPEGDRSPIRDTGSSSWPRFSRISAGTRRRENPEGEEFAL
jgi:hypothetical protein